MGKPPTKRPSQTDTTDTDSDEAHDLEHEIERQIGEIIPKKHRDEVVRRVTTIVAAEQFSGPIAHPRHLQQYEMILPGSADRIISMAEERNHHHIEMDRKLADAEIADRRRGMYAGAFLFALLIVAALIAGLVTGSATLAGVFMGSAVIGGVGVFIKGRNG